MTGQHDALADVEEAQQWTFSAIDALADTVECLDRARALLENSAGPERVNASTPRAHNETSCDGVHDEQHEV